MACKTATPSRWRYTALRRYDERYLFLKKAKYFCWWQVNEIFDAISYCKGASVIRMVANYLGEADFRKGLNIYLKKHTYANATTEVI